MEYVSSFNLAKCILQYILVFQKNSLPYFQFNMKSCQVNIYILYLIKAFTYPSGFYSGRYNLIRNSTVTLLQWHVTDIRVFVETTVYLDVHNSKRVVLVFKKELFNFTMISVGDRELYCICTDSIFPYLLFMGNICGLGTNVCGSPSRFVDFHGDFRYNSI